MPLIRVPHSLHSAALPGFTVNPIILPTPSIAATILVVRPPRLLPMAFLVADSLDGHPFLVRLLSAGVP